MGMRAPASTNRCGFFKKSMISATSSLASSMPATSARRTLDSSGLMSRARLLPKAGRRPPDDGPPPLRWK